MKIFPKGLKFGEKSPHYLSGFIFLELLFIEPSAVCTARVSEPVATVFISKLAVGFANVEVWNGYAVLCALKLYKMSTEKVYFCL